MTDTPLKKFYIEFVGSLPVRWGIELEAVDVEEAKADAIRSLPEFSSDWSIGDGNEQVIEPEIVSVADLGTQEPHDRDLGRLELETKYTACHGDGWGHHPQHGREIWQNAVAEGDTVEGYWDWVYNMLQNEDEPDETH